MTERVLLVDYENVQAVDLAALPSDVKVGFVLGAKQTKLPTDLAVQAQGLGDRFAYVLIRGQQPNAVDFCIAFYLGELLARDPGAECVILSKDKKGFDPLVKHLTADRGFNVRRVNTQKDAFPVEKKPGPSGGTDEPYAKVLAFLRVEKHPPKKRVTLENRIKSYLPKLAQAEHKVLLDRLFREGKVREVEGKLEYAL